MEEKKKQKIKEIEEQNKQKQKKKFFLKHELILLASKGRTLRPKGQTKSQKHRETGFGLPWGRDFY